MITYDDLKHLLEKLYKTCETNERALNSENLNWQQTRNQIRVLLQQILSGIGITGKYLPGTLKPLRYTEPRYSEFCDEIILVINILQIKASSVNSLQVNPEKKSSLLKLKCRNFHIMLETPLVNGTRLEKALSKILQSRWRKKSGKTS